MTSRTLFVRLTLSVAAVTLMACADAPPMGPTDLTHVATSGVDAAGGLTTLAFNGADANASTPLGTVLTTQIDDIAFSATVRFDGPNAASSHQMIFYNGHGAVTGWGIIVLGAPHGLPDGSIGILAGGIDIPMTPFVMTPGKWHHIYAERRGQQVSVTFDDQTYIIGGLGVNPIGGQFAGIERTSVGGDGTFDAPTGDFHGAIDNVRVLDLSTDTWIEHWNFNEGSGATATGTNGTVLHIGNGVWAKRSD